MNVADDVSQHVGAGSITYEGWFKKPTTTHAQQAPIITNFKIPTAPLLGLYIGGTAEPYTGKLHFHYRTTNSEEFGLKSTVTVDDNAWHHVAAVKDAAKDSIYIYLDGVLNAAIPVIIGNTDTGQGFAMGGGHLGRFMHVTIDELRIWNKALSAAEVQYVMGTCIATTDPSLIAYWPFEEGTDTATSDISIHTNDGVLTGGASWATSLPFTNCTAPLSNNSNLIIDSSNLFVNGASEGVILKSPDGNCWKLTVNNSGALQTTLIPCPSQ